MQAPAYAKLATAALLALTQTGFGTKSSLPEQASAPLSAQTRAELLAARDATWRAFFSDEPSQLNVLLGPELIAIQQHQERWENRDQLMKLAAAIRKQGVKITQLEFPRTEIQVFGDVAILYYTYIFGTGDGRRSVTDAGRGTEIFVRRGGQWVDVGWHLDNGAFVRRDGAWKRVAASPSGSSTGAAN